MITTYHEISYFAIDFDRKSTLIHIEIEWLRIKAKLAQKGRIGGSAFVQVILPVLR